MYIDTLNDNLGESGYREAPAEGFMRFGEHTPVLFACLSHRTNSPKKNTPAERLRRYIEFKYGKLNVKVKKKSKVEKKP